MSSTINYPAQLLPCLLIQGQFEMRDYLNGKDAADKVRRASCGLKMPK
ncbi:hypothetical protein [Vibrio furnissii]|nr:hypothetical protein [Vibrio furnissii]